jgi:hypothetical protein
MPNVLKAFTPSIDGVVSIAATNDLLTGEQFRTMSISIHRPAALPLPALLAFTALVALAVFAMSSQTSAARADSGGLLSFGESNLVLPGPTAVDPSDANSIYVSDSVFESPTRIQKFAADGTLQAATNVPGVVLQEEPQGLVYVAGLAIDSGLHRLYALVAENGPASSAVEILAYSTTPKCSTLDEKCATGEVGELVPATGPGIIDGVLVDFRQPASEAAGVDYASGVAVDPGTGDVVVLGVDDVTAQHPKTVLQYISQAGGFPTRISDLNPDHGPGIDPDAPLTGAIAEYGGTVAPNGLAISPDGHVYILSGSSNESQRSSSPAYIYRLPRESAAAELFVTDSPAASPLVLPGASQPQGPAGSKIGSAGSIAISADGEIIYLSEDDGGGLRARGYDTTTGLAKVVYGGGTGQCAVPGAATGGVAAGSGEFLALVRGTFVGQRVYTFGEGGSGCPLSKASFKVNNESTGTIIVRKGEAASFDASGSPLAGTASQADWYFEGFSHAVSEVAGSLTTTHKYFKVGTYEVGLRIHNDGAPALTDPVTQTVKVVGGTPIASFTASTKTPAAGEAIAFDATASIDPTGTETAEPTHELATYKWDFGDGSTEETTKPKTSHAFANPSPSALSRTIKLTVISKDGVTSATPFPVTLTVGGTPSSGGGSTPTPTPVPTPAPSPAPNPTTPPKPVKCKKGFAKKHGKCVKQKHRKHKKQPKHKSGVVQSRTLVADTWWR